MPEVVPEGQIDIDALTADIRGEIDRRRGDGPLPERAPAPAAPLASAPELDTARMLIGQARRVANTGTMVPPFGTFGPVRRRLARFATRILYYALKVITVDQAVFNRLVLDVLANIGNSLQRGDASLGAALANLERALTDSAARVGDRLEALDNRLREVANALAAVRTEAVAQNRRAAVLLQDLWKHPPDAAKCADPPPISSTAGARHDALYAAFEDEFRGVREEIADRQRVYLPFIRQANLGTDDCPILDVGSGRGEWLEVLQHAGLTARGVDLNPILVEGCRSAGLDVVQGDALAYLRGVPDGSLGAVTAFHVIEHLPFEVFIDLVDETVRVLRPGGMAIFETPNPENVAVGSCTFYADPFHQRPIPPPVAKFFLEQRGLWNVTTLYLNPAADDQRVTPEDSDLTRRFNQYFYGPRDYAVVGRKP